jgi:hypothetical protein
MSESKFSGALNRLRKAPEESSTHQPSKLPDAAPNTPQRRFGKSADPAWTKITILMRRAHKRNVRRRLEDEGEGRDLSTLIDQLLGEWMGK